MKTLYGTTRTIAETLNIIGNGGTITPELATASRNLAKQLENGELILDPWELADVYGNTNKSLSYEQAVQVLTKFENNDYRTQEGNETLEQIIYELEAN